MAKTLNKVVKMGAAVVAKTLNMVEKGGGECGGKT